MPQITTFTLNDRESTPVGHVFTAGDKANGIVQAVRSTGIPGTDEVVTISSRDSGRNRKVRFVLSVPIIQTETINGVSNPKEVRRGRADVTLTFDKYSTLQERKNVVGMLANALAASQTQLDAVFTALERPW